MAVKQINQLSPGTASKTLNVPVQGGSGDAVRISVGDLVKAQVGGLSGGITTLGQSISNPPTQEEVVAVQDKVNECAQKLNEIITKLNA